MKHGPLVTFRTEQMRNHQRVLLCKFHCKAEAWRKKPVMQWMQIRNEKFKADLKCKTAESWFLLVQSYELQLCIFLLVA